MMNSVMKKVAALLLERASKIETVSEHSLEVLRRLLARDGDLGTLFVEFRDGDPGSAPGVELRVGIDCLAFHDDGDGRPIVEVNWSSAGTQTVEVARKFAMLLSNVATLGAAVEAEIGFQIARERNLRAREARARSLDDRVPCPICGGELEVDPSDNSESYCTECGRSFEAEELTR